jgi:hypothetical protein
MNAELGAGRVRYGAEKWRGLIRGSHDSAESVRLHSGRFSAAGPDLEQGSSASLVLAEGNSANGNRTPYSRGRARKTNPSSDEFHGERAHDIKNNQVEFKTTVEAGKDIPYSSEQVPPFSPAAPSSDLFFPT